MNRNAMLSKLSSAQFALWESHMFLDTHPCNMEVQRMHESYQEKYSALRKEYEAAFGPLSPQMGNSDQWLQNPWPWDYVKECDD